MKIRRAGVRKQSFTLVEILVVIGIMAILMGIGLGVMHYAMVNAKESRTKATIEKLKVALEAYKAKHGYYLQTRSDYKFYLDNPAGASPNFADHIDYEYFKNNDTMGTAPASLYVIDGFGNPVYYICPGLANPTSYDIVSFGDDEKPGKTDVNDDGTAPTDGDADSDGVIDDWADAFRESQKDSDDIKNY